MFKLQAVSNYILLMQNVYLLVFMISEQIKIEECIYTKYSSQNI